MPSKMNRKAYEELIQEDLKWLKKQPRTLEREHIIEIVKSSPDREYGPVKINYRWEKYVDGSHRLYLGVSEYIGYCKPDYSLKSWFATVNGYALDWLASEDEARKHLLTFAENHLKRLSPNLELGEEVTH